MIEIGEAFYDLWLHKTWYTSHKSLLLVSPLALEKIEHLSMKKYPGTLQASQTKRLSLAKKSWLPLCLVGLKKALRKNTSKSVQSIAMEHCLKARVRVLQDVSALFWNFWNHSSCVSASTKINYYFKPMFESLQSLLSCTQISISSNPWLLCNSAINKSWWSGDHRAQGKVSSDEPQGSFQSQLPDAPNEGHPLRSVWEQIGWSKAVEFADATGPTLPGVQNELGKDPTLRHFDPPSTRSPKVESYHIKKTQNLKKKW